MGGGWVGPKDDCLLASLRLDPFCDTTSTLFSPNLTVGDTVGREIFAYKNFRGCPPTMY